MLCLINPNNFLIYIIYIFVTNFPNFKSLRPLSPSIGTGKNLITSQSCKFKEKNSMIFLCYDNCIAVTVLFIIQNTMYQFTVKQVLSFRNT